jgi:hypothetical protein
VALLEAIDRLTEARSKYSAASAKLSLRAAAPAALGVAALEAVDPLREEWFDAADASTFDALVPALAAATNFADLGRVVRSVFFLARGILAVGAAPFASQLRGVGALVEMALKSNADSLFEDDEGVLRSCAADAAEASLAVANVLELLQDQPPSRIIRALKDLLPDSFAVALARVQTAAADIRSAAGEAADGGHESFRFASLLNLERATSRVEWLFAASLAEEFSTDPPALAAAGAGGRALVAAQVMRAAATKELRRGPLAHVWLNELRFPLERFRADGAWAAAVRRTAAGGVPPCGSGCG